MQVNALSRRHSKNRLSRALALVLCAAVVSAFAGCQKKAEPVTQSGFLLDTVVRITIYDKEDHQLLAGCFDKIAEYEKIFSRTDPESELWAVNHRGTASSVEVSEPMRELTEKGLAYCELSGGAFDIAIAPLTELWNFKASDKSVPPKVEIEAAKAKCDYKTVSLSGNRIEFASPDAMLDFGALAKGYIADKVKAYLVENGVKSAVINLGGNVLCVGEKSGGEAFHIGVRKPFSDDTVRTVAAKDLSIVTSGVYERYFEENGVLYHHILNPATGYPYNNGLSAVTVLSESSLDGDGYSTLLFSLGLEEGMKLVDSADGIEAFFITEDGKVHYSEGAEKLLLP